MGHDQLEQRDQVLAFSVERFCRPSRPARCIKHWKIKLFIACAKTGEQVKNFIQSPIRLGVGLIDLVQNHHWLEAQRQGFRGHEFCLRHRAFGSIDQQNHAIDHRENPLNFAAEVRVTRRIHDIDTRAFILDGGTFREDRYTPLSLQVVGIHRSFSNSLIGAKRPGLLQQLINECRFSVVNVGDDRDITQVHRDRLRGQKGRDALPCPKCCAASRTIAPKSRVSVSPKKPETSQRQP